MSEFVGRMQQGLRQNSTDVVLLALKLASGSVIGFTLALVVQEILAQPQQITLAFAFTFSITLAVFWRLTRSWSMSAVLVFDLIAVLTGLLLRLYVMIAPNA